MWQHTDLLNRAWVDFGSYVAISVVYAVFAAWLCVAISPYAAGSGIRCGLLLVVLVLALVPLLFLPLSLITTRTVAQMILLDLPVTDGVGCVCSEIKVVLGGFVIKRLLGGWTLLSKSMGLMLSVGSGMMVGKEGPCVHLACCTANLVSRFFSKYACNEAKKREQDDANCRGWL